MLGKALPILILGFFQFGFSSPGVEPVYSHR